MRRGERGSATPLIALLVLAVGGAVVLLGRVGGAAVDRASARTAADAAALAGAAEGRGAADGVAAADGGRIVSYRQAGTETEVRVRVGQASALARARRESGGSGDGKAPALRAVWTRVGQLLGQAVPVQSVVASSSGQPGMAVLVAPDVAARLATVAPQAGLCRVDQRRFEVCR
jgi:putative Flp pilus-assembly TadE/G-like protein